MRIAVLGAGFCGIASCWHLLKYQRPDLKIEIDLYDPKGIGGGTSSLAAGLLHPYVGMEAKYSKHGNEGMRATRQLLEVAAEALQQPVADYSGILRLAITEELHRFYSQSAAVNTEVQWYSAEQCQALVPSIPSFEGIFIKEGITVYSQLYLEGLWQACTSQGAILKPIACQKIKDLEDYDAVVVATGASIKQFPEFSHLRVNTIKGQVLKLSWPEGLNPLPLPFNALGYLVMDRDKRSCIAGSTYERHFSNAEPDLEVAKKEILPKLEPIFPWINKATILDCRAGLRATTPNREPLCKQVAEKCWVITGMGSRGLLYHALMAEQLAAEMIGTR